MVSGIRWLNLEDVARVIWPWHGVTQTLWCNDAPTLMLELLC